MNLEQLERKYEIALKYIKFATEAYDCEEGLLVLNRLKEIDDEA
jgi:hypothetical protein